MTTLTKKYSSNLFSEPFHSNQNRHEYANAWDNVSQAQKKVRRFPSQEIYFQIQGTEALQVEKILEIGDENISLPFQLNEIAEEIESSEFILDLKDDWDNQGGLPVKREVYFASIKFLIQYSRFLFEKGVVIDAPEIDPCTDGSVDLSWRTANARLLINFRKTDKGLLAYFYGDLYQNEAPTKGNVPVEMFSESLAVWMKNLK